MPRNVYAVLWNEDTDPAGNPLALVIFRDRRFEYIPHAELGV